MAGKDPSKGEERCTKRKACGCSQTSTNQDKTRRDSRGAGQRSGRKINDYLIVGMALLFAILLISFAVYAMVVHDPDILKDTFRVASFGIYITTGWAIGGCTFGQKISDVLGTISKVFKWLEEFSSPKGSDSSGTKKER
jgi:hypothetical protein